MDPDTLLEIGFNVGHSALLWLDHTRACVTSVDIGIDPSIARAAKQIKQWYPERFRFWHTDSRFIEQKYLQESFDLLFIDGGHNEEVFSHDLTLSQKWDIPNLVIDDYLRSAVVRRVTNQWIEEGKLTLRKKWDIGSGVLFCQRNST